jgi:hypothetical protein
MKRLLVLSLLVAACQGDDAANTDDVATSEEGLSVVEGGEDLVLASASLEGTSTIPAAEAAMAADFTVPACVTIVSDHATYLEATFNNCTGRRGLVVLNGTLRAQISVSGGAVVYDLSTTGLTIGQTSVTGSWQLRDPIAAGPTTLTAAVTISRRGRSLSLDASASWTVSGECVTYSYDADWGTAARSLSIEATDVTRCANACPASGTVTVSVARGTVLSWTYDGTAEVVVTGPRGGEHSITLACGR